MDGKEILNFDTNAMTWEGLEVKELNFAIPWIPLHEDPETGANVFVMRYPAGFTNPWHHHDCSHGIYVLKGVLNTPIGKFGPGSYVWFPEGSVHYHGATAESDVTFLFITNKKFDIMFVDKNPEEESKSYEALKRR